MDQPVRRKKKRRLRLRRVIGVSMILLAVLIWNVPGFARASSGDCLAAGDLSANVHWQINSMNGDDSAYSLSIWRDGENDAAIGNFTSETIPWKSEDIGGLDPDRIKDIRIYEGITGIGNYAFKRLINLDTVTMTSDIVSIGDYAFPNAGESFDIYVFSDKDEETWLNDLDVKDSIASIKDRFHTFSVESGAAVPTLAPTANPTPTATAEPTPTAVPTSTPTAAPSATPTSTSRATATATLAATATPTATSRATATSTARATSAATSSARATATATGTAATPTSTPAPTATAYSANITNNTSFYNPYAVVRNTGNAKDMPRTGDGDAARYLIVAGLIVVGCIVLISSIPRKTPGKRPEE